MIYYKSSKELLTRYLEYLPTSARIAATEIAAPAHIRAANKLLNGELDDPTFDMREFIRTRSVFVHIPKSAGRSIRRQVYSGFTCSHTSMYWYTLALRNFDIRDFFIYSIVRNPWDRLHSAYYFLKKGGAHQGDANQFTIHLSKFASFQDFVLDLPRFGIPPIVHMKPMHFFLELTGKKALIDYIGYFEDIDSSYECILNRLSILNPEIRCHDKLHADNRNTEKPCGYLDEYTPKMIDIVSRAYRRDIDLFGYSFNGYSRKDAAFKCRA